ncbi:MAG: DUF4349 domain-containing protein [Anaerolineales bacterium]|nr:DUF4349 domain-containing protein [Anaerolineales bacterium]
MIPLKRLALIAAALALTLAACAPALQAPSDTDAKNEDAVTSGGSADYYTDGEQAAPPAATMAAPQEAPAGAGGAAAAPRLVIKNATLSLVVADPAAAVTNISNLATSLGGFVVSSYTYEASVDAAGNTITQANLTIRVPAEQLDAALAQIKRMAVEVRTENVSGQDVTAEYTDLQSRLRNLQAAADKLTQILDNATKTEDVLAVFNQLTYTQEQIEVIKGQIKYYEESAALSAISLELIPDALSRPLEVGGWQPQGVAKEALEGLVRNLQGLADILIRFFVGTLPMLIVIFVPLYIVLRIFLRLTKRPRRDTPNVPPTPPAA